MLMLVSSLILGMSAVAGRWSSRLVMLHDAVNPDLPCPWCRTATIEDDSACPGCGHRFG
ncbi:MAG: hypothetical protein QY307_00555 [Acidimicrobiia bacterium]|nr:MAG: hypothetical protein QY307_00555 [Acidimicrobiia bacterium]